MEKYDGAEAVPPALDDPWYDAPGAGWDTWLPAQEARTADPAPPTDGELYLAVQRSPGFQQVRSRYRSFVVPATVAFLGWYLAYIVAATVEPKLMAHPVAGVVNVAMLAGLGQFATTFLLTWAYARHARLRRDRAALELRWDLTVESGREGRQR